MSDIDEIVTASLARARRNADLGIALDTGADVDETLRALGLPTRSALLEPPMPIEFIRESGPRRVKQRKKRKRASTEQA